MVLRTDAYNRFDSNRAVEDKWKLVLDAMGDGMWDLDIKAGKIYFSEKWQDIFGYTSDDLMQEIALWSQKVHPDDYAVSVTKFGDIFEGKTSNYNAEIRYLCKDGNYKWILSRGVVIAWDDNGDPMRMIGTHKDIQQRKLAEEAMKANNRELEITKIKLEDKVKRLEELNHLIAHNMRGPASNIKMLADVLQEIEDGAGDDAPFTRPQAISMIRAVNSAFLQNLHVLLEAAQVSLNRDIQYTPVDIANVITEITNQLSAEVHEKKAEINTDIKVAQILYPRAYFSSILYNLLSNALKYTQPGVTPHIDITVARKKHEIVLTVRDNGLGIDLQKFQDKIFKLNQVFHIGYDSKGVGLYMTKIQVESLGGRIMVDSKPDEGSTFTVYFPITD